MLGHRGCRLGITYPEITEMQARAMFEAAVDVAERGHAGVPGDHDPAGRRRRRSSTCRRRSCARRPSEVFAERGKKVGYLVGTMIEIPARRADRRQDRRDGRVLLVRHQRPDADRRSACRATTSRASLAAYQAQDIYQVDPFVSIDREGVGGADEDGGREGPRRTKPKLKLGICGEHGGDPASVEFCHEVGLDYVSCSPYRLPIARLAAAQAALKQ